MAITKMTLSIRRGYTLIELLIVIAIISILIGILVPLISRSLSKNKLASDVDVMRSKIEETRLLAGSTQINDAQLGADINGVSRVGYYGIFLPTISEVGSPANYNGKHFYAITRLSKPFTTPVNTTGYCMPTEIVSQALAGSGPCIIERVDLTGGVVYWSITVTQNRMIAFAVPSQQLVELYQLTTTCTPTRYNSYCWQENASGPVFNQTIQGNPYFTLRYGDKYAKINIEPYTGKLKVQYTGPDTG